MIDAQRSVERRHAVAAPAMAAASRRRACLSKTLRTRVAARLMAGGVFRASAQKNVPAVQIGANAGDAMRADARGNPRRKKWRRARRAYPKVT